MAAEADYKSKVNHGAGGAGVSRTKGLDHLSHLISFHTADLPQICRLQLTRRSDGS